MGPAIPPRRRGADAKSGENRPRGTGVARKEECLAVQQLGRDWHIPEFAGARLRRADDLADAVATRQQALALIPPSPERKAAEGSGAVSKGAAAPEGWPCQTEIGPPRQTLF